MLFSQTRIKDGFEEKNINSIYVCIRVYFQIKKNGKLTTCILYYGVSTHTDCRKKYNNFVDIEYLLTIWFEKGTPPPYASIKNLSIVIYLIKHEKISALFTHLFLKSYDFFYIPKYVNPPTKKEIC